ncbi:MAG TPA: RICIN domain-containing protein [Actinokineospora sp.]|nr:RICIN domain-containing protein [Actinokineospora sp.]
MPVIRSLSLPTTANWLGTDPAYSYEDLAPVSGGFDRVGYCLELTTAAGATSWVWTSFAAADSTLLGMPTRTGQVFRGDVSALTVASNVAGVTAGSGRSGYLEMWPNTYEARSAGQVAGASSSTYDSDDSPTAGGGYGSFQVSDAGAGKPVVSVNGFTTTGTMNMGIGAQATGNPDWTFAANAGSYSTRTLTVFARPSSVSLSAAPKPGQLYPRSLSTNKASVPVTGTTRSAAVTSVELEVWRSGTKLSTTSQPTSGAGAAFAFSPSITAELANYELRLFTNSAAGRREVGTYPNLVAGDAYVITGQSNAQSSEYSGSAEGDLSPWARSFGTSTHDATLSSADRGWHKAAGNGNYQSGSIGQWGTRMSKRIIDTYGVPVAIINGAHGGQPISFFQRDDATPKNATTNYGRLLGRLDAAGLTAGLRAILFYQGESDNNNAGVHVTGFTSLFTDWRSDFGTATKVYPLQVRASGCNQSGLELREAQRQLRLNLDVTVLSTLGTSTLTDNCHYPYVGGYQKLGDHNFAALAKDLYAGSTAGVSAPEPASATINAAGTQITVQLRNTTDTVTAAAGVAASFKLEGSPATVTAVTAASGGRLLLDLSAAAPEAKGVTYSVMAPNAPGITNATGVGMFVFKDMPLLVAGQKYVITNVGSGKSIDVPGSTSTVATQLIQWTTHSAANQQWIATPAADGTYTLRSQATGHCFDVHAASTTAGAAIDQYTCHSGANQRWWITSAIGGGYTLTSASSRMAITAAGTADGAKLVQQPDTDTAAQRWTFTKI